MALSFVKFDQLSNLLSFPKSVLPQQPLFEGRKKDPAIAKSIQITTQPFSTDEFNPVKRHIAPPTSQKHVTIVLSSPAALPERILSIFSPAIGAGGTSYYNESILKQLGDVIAQLTNGKPKSEVNGLGQLYATFQPEVVKKSKATAEDRAAVGLKNQRAMVSAFKESLAKLPKNVQSVTIDLPDKLPNGVNRQALIRDLSTEIALTGYNYNFHKSTNWPTQQLEQVALAKTSFTAADNKALTEGQAIGEAMNLTRHLVDSPTAFKTSLYIGQQALKLESPTLKPFVRERAWIEGNSEENTKRMGLFLSVAQGNADQTEREPRLVEMVYTPANGKFSKTVLLVGKGILFDTGGVNLKAGSDTVTGKAYIHGMQGDMAGAAAVIGTMKLLDQLQLQGVRVVGLAPLTENRMDGKATLPNDIHTARNGKTVQISNTDAEGRLVLADAIHYGMERYQPDVVADIATLTGGKVKAVGAQNAIALAGNNQELVDAANKISSKSLGRTTGVWKLTENHHAWVTKGGKGKADIYNSVSQDDAKVFGVISSNSIDPLEPMRQHSAQGAAFLREFLTDAKTPWVHYDIAGAEFNKPNPKLGNEEWASAIGVQDLYHLVKAIAEGSVTPNREKTDVTDAARLSEKRRLTAQNRRLAKGAN